MTETPRVNTQSYEPQIDGIRALAVLSVLLFHMNNAWVPGGYVGVDVFFVISGYLITSTLVKSINENKMSLKEFYRRRIKRIIPVYMAVVIFTSVASYSLFLPDDNIDFFKSLFSSLLFVSNFYFWIEQDYFARSTELLPLLHTWSLSVEEQYYVFWPLLLLLGYRYVETYRARFILLVFLVVSASLLSLFLTVKDASFGYYSIFSRAFELGVGGLLSFIVAYKEVDLTKYSTMLLQLFGIVLIACSIIFFSKSIFFPGGTALVPVLGTAALILACRGEQTSISRLLASRPFVSIGLLSYSIYMWHWPMLSIARYVRGELIGIDLLILFVLIMFVSYLSWKLLERPIVSSALSFRQAVITIFAIPSALLMVLGIFAIVNEGRNQRFETKEVYSVLAQANGIKSSNCFGEHFKLYLGEECVIGTSENRIALWGDSHAHTMRTFIERIALDVDVSFTEFAFWGCPPLYNVYRKNRTYGKTCAEHNERVLKHLIDKKYKAVFLVASWNVYVKTGVLSRFDNSSSQYDHGNSLFVTAANDTFNRLNEAGIAVIILDSIPLFPIDPHRCLAKSMIFDALWIPDCDYPVHDYQSASKESKGVFTSMLVDEKIDAFISFSDQICNELACNGYVDNKMLYSDKSHLSLTGIEHMYEKKREIVVQIMQKYVD